MVQQGKQKKRNERKEVLLFPCRLKKEMNKLNESLGKYLFDRPLAVKVQTG